MDDEQLMAWIEARFSPLTERMDQHFEQICARLEKVEIGLRHANGQIENVRGDMRQLTETMMDVESSVFEARQEPLKELRGSKSMYRLTYSMLEDHMKSHEQKLSNLDARLSALENTK